MKLVLSLLAFTLLSAFVFADKDWSCDNEPVTPVNLEKCNL